MKVFVKTLRGTTFEVQVQPNDTVAHVKKNIEAAQGVDVYPATQQMLIHQGKVLKDNTTLDENKVAENSFIVIMLTKNKSGPGEGSSASAASKTKAPQTSIPATTAPQTSIPATTAPQTSIPATTAPQTSIPATTAPQTSIPATTAHQAPASSFPTLPPLSHTPVAPVPASISAVPSAVPEADVYGEAASNLVAGTNLEGTIQQILDMGGGTWDRSTVLRALRAAYNNPERAVEYLYSGIPEQAEVPSTANAPVGGQVANPEGQPQQPPPNPSTGPNANPLDLFPQGLPSMGVGEAGAGTLDFLRNSQQFQALRAMVQANPQILQPMLQELGKQNPHLMRLIQEHQADFLRLINEPVEGGEGNVLGQLAAAMPQSVTVTPEEREAIERLEAMGFDRALVLEVFFACNKNEELAANYLLDHMHEFEE